jgi:hypothetical protein
LIDPKYPTIAKSCGLMFLAKIGVVKIAVKSPIMDAPKYSIEFNRFLKILVLLIVLIYF